MLKPLGRKATRILNAVWFLTAYDYPRFLLQLKSQQNLLHRNQGSYCLLHSPHMNNPLHHLILSTTTKSWKTFPRIHLQIQRLFQSRKPRKSRSNRLSQTRNNQLFHRFQMNLSQTVRKRRKSHSRNNNRNSSEHLMSIPSSTRYSRLRQR